MGKANYLIQVICIVIQNQNQAKIKEIQNDLKYMVLIIKIEYF